MNSTPRTQTNLAVGFAAQGIGSPIGSLDRARKTFELLASAQAGAQLGTTATK